MSGDPAASIAGAVSTQALVAKWLDHLSSERRLSNHTLAAYSRDARDFFSFLQDHLGEPATSRDLDVLVLRDFRAWLAARHKRRNSRRSTARALSAVRSFYRFCERDGTLKNDAIHLVQSPKLPHSHHCDRGH